MLWTNIKRIIKSGFQNFWRNGFVSLSAVLVLFVTLFVIGGVLLSSVLLQSSLAEIKDKVDINVYFTTTAQESDILTLKKNLEALPEVKSVAYTTSEQALANFKDLHKDDQLTLQALNELDANPLGAILNIKAKDPSQYESIANFLKSDSALASDKQSIIEEVNYYNNKAAIDRLAKIIVATQQIGLALSILLAIISVIIAFNTVRLTIFISREEISVMRLVGASNKYVRGPFVITGIIYGLIAGILVVILFYPLTYYLRVATASFFGGINLFTYYISNFGQFFAVVIGSGILLGAISSYLAVRRYLKI